MSIHALNQYLYDKLYHYDEFLRPNRSNSCSKQYVSSDPLSSDSSLHYAIWLKKIIAPPDFQYLARLKKFNNHF